MLRSLHRKLVLILVLLIISLMAVVGAFLINGAVSFYTREFSSQMNQAWSENTEFVNALRRAADNENSPVGALSDVMYAWAGSLGIDAARRNFYILDGMTAESLATSDPQNMQPDLTPNIKTALSGENGAATRQIDTFFDIAIPIGGYIIYIRDNRDTLERLNAEMFAIIMQAVLFGLVISILLSFLLSKTITTPLENLTRSVKQVADGDFSDRPEVHSADEIGLLTQTFNNMANVLRDSLEAIGSERDKLGTLFLHMTDGVAAFSGDGAMIHINPAAERMLGISYHDGLRFDALFDNIVNWEDVHALQPPDFLETNASRLGRSLKVFFAVFGSKDSENGVIAVVHDITEQQRLEEVRREFVSNVSHELRTPLTNIKSYAETLLLPEDLPPETIQGFSQVIVNEADRMTRIVRDLLTLSKFDYGKMDWSMGLFSVGEALKSIYDAMLLEAKRHNHQMTLEYICVPPAIWGDRDRIEQVLVNIVSNAITYTPDGGTIELKLDMVDDFVAVTVKDNGVGIPEESIPRLFERFFRVDKHRSRASGGTGLGLAIAQEIISKHDGKIELKSKPGEGTEITVLLPVRRPEA